MKCVDVMRPKKFLSMFQMLGVYRNPEIGQATEEVAVHDLDFVSDLAARSIRIHFRDALEQAPGRTIDTPEKARTVMADARRRAIAVGLREHKAGPDRGAVAVRGEIIATADGGPEPASP